MSKPLELPAHVQHGTQTAYVKYKCRCSDCRASNADYMANWRERRKIQAPDTYLPATYSVGRVQELLQRMSVEKLVLLTGLSHTTIHNLNANTNGNQARVTPRVEHSLRTLVPIQNLHSAHTLVSADPTRRRLQHLRLMGYGVYEISKGVGLEPKTIYRLLRGQNLVKNSTHEAVKDAHKRMSRYMSRTPEAPRIASEAALLGYTPYEEKK